MTITEQIRSVRQAIGQEYRRPDAGKLVEYQKSLEQSDRARDYIHITRGLSDDTIKHFGLGYDADRDAIAIPIYKKGELVNIKYRFLNPDKVKYSSERGAETWLYNEDGIQNALERGSVLIVEGEFDLMSCWQAGIRAVVSPASGKDSYGVWIELLDRIPRVYIAYDNDDAGKKAGKQFADRLGTEKCFEVKYPDGIKDANDYFKVSTLDDYKQIVKNATPYYSYQFRGVGDIMRELRENEVSELALRLLPKVKIERDWLIVVSGKTNCGKTTYCMNVADELAKSGIPCLIMPFERGSSSVGKRFLQVAFDKTVEDIRFASKDEWQAMVDMASNMPVYFSTPKKEEISDIVVKSKRLFDTRVVIIDHLDYVVRHTSQNREVEIANTLQSLKRIGEEQGIIFIVVTHIRKIEFAGSQAERQPNIEDLKGSSSLYQDPECVVLLTSEAAGALRVNVAKNKGDMGAYNFSIDLQTGKIGEQITLD